MSSLSPSPSRPGRSHSRSPSRFGSSFKRIFGSRDPSPNPAAQQMSPDPSIIGPQSINSPTPGATPSNSGTPVATPGGTPAIIADSVLDDDSSLWTQALSRLTDKEKIKLGITSPNIDSSILDELTSRVEQKRDLCLSRQWKLQFGQRQVVLRDVTENLFGLVNQFKDLGDIAASFDTATAGLPWSGVCALLGFVTADSETMAAMLVGAEFAAACISRAGCYEALYITPEKLPDEQLAKFKEILIDFYESILQFLSKLISYLDHNTTVRFLAANFSETFVSVQSTVEENEDTIRKHADIADAFLTSQNFEALSEGQKENFNTLHKMLDDMKEPMATLMKKMDDMKIVADENLDVARETHKLVQKAMNDKSRKVLSATIAWISKVDPQKRYRQLRDARQPGSGDWLIESDEMKKWLDITDGEKTFIWLQGRAGSGKSMQSATISHHIKANRPADHPFLEFYCDYSENREITTPEFILKSLLAQICGYAEDVPAKIKAAYQESQMTGLPLDMPVKELAKEIATMLSLYDSATVIIDALDECPDPKTLFASLYSVFDGVKATDLRMLVTSRDNLRPLRSSLKAAPDAQVLDMSQKLDAINKDIRVFLERKMDDMMANDDFTVIIDDDKDIQEDILNTLSTASDGIILYASILLSEFSRIPSKSKLREAIATPPVGLQALFVNCLQRIASDRWFHLDTAQKVCMWVLTAKRPLHIDEIKEAISVEPGKTKKWDEDDFAPKTLIRECAAGLLIIDADEVVKFVHGSLVDFFLGNCPFGDGDPLSGFFWNEEKRSEMVVRASLEYLKYENFNISTSKDIEEFKFRISRYSLLEYTSKYWFRHYKGSLEETNADLFLDFVDNSPDGNLEHWLEVLFTDTQEFRETSKYHFNFGTGVDLPYGQYPRYANKHCLRRHLICMFGFTELLKACTTEELVSTSAEQNSYAQTGLYVALAWREWNFAEVLIKSSTGSSEVLNQASVSGYSAIHIAATSGQLQLVQDIVKVGGNPTLAPNGEQPLSLAARDGDSDIVKYLISKGSKVDMISSRTGFFPLYYACAAGRLDVIKELLAVGADITMPTTNPDGLTALHIAATAGDEETLHTIFSSLSEDIKLKAANTMDAGIGSTPLMMTDSAASTRVFLQHGADPRKRSKLGFTAFDVAQSQNRLSVISELLKVPEGRECLELGKELPGGIDLKRIPGFDASSVGDLDYIQKPLVTALFTDNLGVVELIMKASQEHPELKIYTKEKKDKELQITTMKMRSECLNALLSYGVDVNHKFEGGTPLLIRACEYLGVDSQEYGAVFSSSRADILQYIRVLLKHGVDVNAVDGKGGTALHCVSYHGDLDAAGILLDSGADVSFSNNFGATPLHNTGSPETLKLLLERGAGITEIDSMRQNVAHFAANRGLPKILDYIKKEIPLHEKVLSSPQCSGFTPLTMAIHAGHIECVKVLLPVTDIGGKVEGNNTYLHSAVEGPQMEILEMIVQAFKEKGLSLEEKNLASIPPVVLSAALKKPAYLKYLLDEGANPLLPWPTTDLAPVYPSAISHLSIAILTEDDSFDEVVDVLLEFHKEKKWMDIPDNYGNGPLHYAVKNKSWIQKLVKAGFDVNATNDMGDTPLHFATRFEGTEEVVKELIAAGADIDKINYEGRRAGDMIKSGKGVWGWFGY